MPRIKAATLVLRIEPELKALAQRAAADDRRSLASLIEGLLADYLCEKGYLRPTQRDTVSSLTDEQRAQVARCSALNRLAEVGDVADTVEFLLSDKARNITGTVITVDAGATA